MTSYNTFDPPHERDSIHLMADYVEVLCLASSDGEISMDQAISRVFKSACVEAETEFVNAEMLYVERAGFDHAEISDSKKRKGEQWFEYLLFREEAYGNFYPFELSGSVLKRKCVFGETEKIYICLLICSNLRLISTNTNQLTADFELLCLEVFKSYLPGFTVHYFGKSSHTRKYPSKLYDAIRLLAENLKEDCSEIALQKSINNWNIKMGDGGLDLVAWRRPWNDDIAQGSLICFAQCTCKKEWIDKQNEAHSKRWNKRIYFVHPNANLLFIPFCFRNATGGWFERDKIDETILMDRLRICKLLDASKLSSLNSSSIVSDFVNYREE